MQAKEIIAKMTTVFDSITAINEDMKLLKEEAKASGMDGAILSTIAKSISDGKSGKLRGKYENTLDLLDQLDD